MGSVWKPCKCGHELADHAQPGQGRSRLMCEYHDCECQDFSIDESPAMTTGEIVTAKEIEIERCVFDDIWVNRSFDTLLQAVRLLRKADEFLYTNPGLSESENTEIEIAEFLKRFDGE